MNTRPIEAELFHPDRRAEGRTDGRTDGQINMKLTAAVRNFADTRNKGNFIGPRSKYNTTEERKYDK
jgi:hypothetical protein